MIRCGALLGMVALISACASGRDGPLLSSGERYGAFSADAYRLGAGDRIRMTVYNEEGLTGEFAVSDQGTVSLPLIGAVQARGKTLPELSATVQGQLGNGYLRDPQVAMEVVTYRPFYILGEVRTPGQYPFQIGLTVPMAIAVAQGYTPRSDKEVVRIRREGSDVDELYQVTPSLRVYPGDTIQVGERFF